MHIAQNSQRTKGGLSHTVPLPEASSVPSFLIISIFMNTESYSHTNNSILFHCPAPYCFPLTTHLRISLISTQELVHYFHST